MTFLFVASLLLARAFLWFPTVTISPRTLPPPDTKIRLFVRPYQAIAGEAGQSEFAEGLTSELITRLGGLDPKHLGVIAPTSQNFRSLQSCSEAPVTGHIAVRKGGHERRHVISVCLKCAQAMAPDWPFLLLWPFLKTSFASSIARLSRSRLSRKKRTGTAQLLGRP